MALLVYTNIKQDLQTEKFKEDNKENLLEQYARVLEGRLYLLCTLLSTTAGTYWALSKIC